MKNRGTPELPHSRQPEYWFGKYRLTSDDALLRGEHEIHLPPKELAALRLLLQAGGKLVTPAQLKFALWGQLHVTDDSVPRCVSSLRARLQPDDCIQTVYKRGYRIPAPVERQDSRLPGSTLRVAILPFAVSAHVPEFLGQAVAEETLALLSRMPTLHFAVLARDSTFTLAQSGRTAQQVGQMLQADLMLTGSLRAFPAHLRLRAEMIRVADDTQVWVEDVLIPLDRIGAAEQELAQRLATRLGEGGLAIYASEERPENDSPEPQSREAWDLFRRGHYEWQTLQRHRMQDGLQHLFRATELDPSLVPAQVDLVNVCITQSLYGFMAPTMAAEQVRRTAAAIPPEFAGAEAVLPAMGWVRFHVDRDLPGALQAFAECAHLPHDPWTTRARVLFALSRHRFAEAVEMLEQALVLDPFSPWLHARLAWTRHLAGQAEASLQQAERALELFPQHEGPILYGAILLAHSGQAHRAVQLAEELSRRSPYFDPATAVHAYALALCGQRDQARAILERMQWLRRERFVLSAFFPAVCVALEDHETALAELRNADRTRCPWFFQMLADPRLEPLHGYDEFVQMTQILTRMEGDAAASSPLAIPGEPF
ncbi:MAG TPA: winged helix-turn-helix domain-containing protein [Terracidiphilus sp.]|nr:winged helix-turn-helix domain-containing protein [Terracidiphilus sp.]